MTTPYEDQPNTEAVPDLRREWMILVRHRQAIAVISVLALLSATLYNYSVRPLYDSVAILSINQTVPGQPLARLSLTAQRLNEIIQKEITRMTGLEFAAVLADRLGPGERAELAVGPVGPWFSRLRFPGAGAAKTDAPRPNKAEAVAALLSRLQIQGRGGSSWVEVHVVGFEPAAVAGIANEVVRSSGRRRRDRT